MNDKLITTRSEWINKKDVTNYFSRQGRKLQETTVRNNTLFRSDENSNNESLAVMKIKD